MHAHLPEDGLFWHCCRARYIGAAPWCLCSTMWASHIVALDGCPWTEGAAVAPWRRMHGRGAPARATCQLAAKKCQRLLLEAGKKGTTWPNRPAILAVRLAVCCSYILQIKPRRSGLAWAGGSGAGRTALSSCSKRPCRSAVATLRSPQVGPTRPSVICTCDMSTQQIIWHGN